MRRPAAECVHDLAGEPLGHRLLVAVAGEAHEPADREGAGAAGRNLDRHLIGGAADSAGLDLEVRRQSVTASSRTSTGGRPVRSPTIERAS